MCATQVLPRDAICTKHCYGRLRGQESTIGPSKPLFLAGNKSDWIFRSALVSNFFGLVSKLFRILPAAIRNRFETRSKPNRNQVETNPDRKILRRTYFRPEDLVPELLEGPIVPYGGPYAERCVLIGSTGQTNGQHDIIGP